MITRPFTPPQNTSIDATLRYKLIDNDPTYLSPFDRKLLAKYGWLPRVMTSDGI